MLVLMGGPDAERRVSLCSGREVARALRACGRFEVHDAVIDRPSAAELSAVAWDVAFPVLHGRFGEGGPLQEVLEAVGRPYVGSAPDASALAMHKIRTKRLLAADGVPLLPDCTLDVADPCRLETTLVLKPLDDGSSVDMAICRNPWEVAAARARLHPARGVIMAERYVGGREVTVGIACGRALPAIEIVPAVEFYDYQAKYHRED
ncbi:MAG: D-alanine--D-alanine ligase, partial [Planctomycetota bacterium]